MSIDKTRFIHELANYLVADQTRMILRLQANDPDAIAWMKLRSATPLFGYPSAAEAIQTLTLFLQ